MFFFISKKLNKNLKKFENFPQNPRTPCTLAVTDPRAGKIDADFLGCLPLPSHPRRSLSSSACPCCAKTANAFRSFARSLARDRGEKARQKSDFKKRCCSENDDDDIDGRPFGCRETRGEPPGGGRSVVRSEMALLRTREETNCYAERSNCVELISKNSPKKEARKMVQKRRRRRRFTVAVGRASGRRQRCGWDGRAYRWRRRRGGSCDDRDDRRQAEASAWI